MCKFISLAESSSSWQRAVFMLPNALFFLFLVKEVTLAPKVTPCTISAVLTTIDWEIPALQLAVSSVWQVRNDQQQSGGYGSSTECVPPPPGLGDREGGYSSLGKEVWCTAAWGTYCDFQKCLRWYQRSDLSRHSRVSR